MGKKQVQFFKIGGTWDMVTKQGKLEGQGILDDQALFRLETELGYFKKKVNYSQLEWKLAQKVEKLLQIQGKEGVPLEEKLLFVPYIGSLAQGTFSSLYSGDSSHFRTGLVIPLFSFLLEYAVQHPMAQIICAQGKDTADISLLPLLDVYTFDTNLPPFLFTGANRSFREPSSDAPKNFSDVLTIAGIPLPPGAYWVFSSYLFQASDLVKVSPLETRTIGEFSTFYSPHLRAKRIDDIVRDNKEYIKKKYSAPQNHISQRMVLKDIFNAIERVCIIDLSEQNELQEDIRKIKSEQYKAIILAAHSFGNGSNPIKYACKEAAQEGKLVILTSRCLICDVNERYSAGLLHVNKELRSSGKRIISAHKLNKNISRALAIRAVHEGLTPDKARVLFDRYAAVRSLSEFDVIMV